MKIELLAPGLEQRGEEYGSWLKLRLSQLTHTQARKKPFNKPYTQQLTDRFSLKVATSGFPFASFIALDALKEHRKSCICVSPVHLDTGIEKVFLYPFDDTQLNRDTVDALITALNSHLEIDGLHIEPVTSSIWLMALPDDKEIQTIPLTVVSGNSMYSMLPTGKDAIYWHRLLNEMQMLLFSLGINHARERQGLLPVNGVWLWGEGDLPETTGRPGVDYVITDSALVKGIAEHCGIPVSGLKDLKPLPGEHDKVLVVDETCYLCQKPFSGEARPDNKVLDQALAMLCEGNSVDKVELTSMSEKLVWKRKPFWRFW